VARSLPSDRLECADQIPSPNAFLNPDDARCELNLEQLKLMHNWYDQASLTLALDESLARSALWNRVVPMLAFEHPFLMHGILAVSVVYVACSRAEMRDSHLLMARQHHKLGSRLLQHPSISQSPPHSQSSQEAKVVFIIMNIVLSLALAERTGYAEQDLNTFIDWLITLRSSFALAHKFYNESLHHGESRISALLRRREDGPSELSTLDEGLTASLDLLDASNRASETASPVDKEHITGAIAKSKLWMRLVSLQPQTALFIATCAVDMTDDFFRLAKEGNPAALITMAHLLVQMCHAPKKRFWGDWFEATVAMIVEVLPIDQRRQNLGWVLKQVDIAHFSFK
jgi:hypothetical protein